MKNKYAWKVTCDISENKHMSPVVGAVESVQYIPAIESVQYIPNVFVKENTPFWGLFVFKNRESARNFQKTLLSYYNHTIWKCEVINLREPKEIPYWLWPEGTMVCDQVKLLHKQ